MRGERQFAVKDKTQKTGFGFKMNGLVVKIGQAQETNLVEGKSAHPVLEEQ